MATVLDHTIVPVRDRDKSVEFYSRILGFENLGEVGPFLAVRVNETLNLDFGESKDFQHFHYTFDEGSRGIHYAFTMERDEFEAVFTRIRESGIAYGDDPSEKTNMKGPGMTLGSQGMGKAVYFEDPDGHVLEIKTY
jgi:catechol 2,3-dioxygenase-like lactoylglutathione lyase family enzyme